MNEMNGARSDALLCVDGLHVTIPTFDGDIQAVRNVSFELKKSETLAIVGESGCGKSMTAMSLLGLLPTRATMQGKIHIAGENLHGLNEKQWRNWRGNRIGIIFQNPMTALNPTMCIGEQIAEPLRLHKGLSQQEAWLRAEQLLQQLYISDAAQRLKQYPFEFSGGMLQRVMIAIAVSCEPDILIADEPTTALDVTVQAEVLALLKGLQQDRQMALLLITHDLAVVAQMAQRVAVMYAGEIVEQGSVETVFNQASHPYTQGLKAALPDFHYDGREPLQVIPGSPPDLLSPPNACGFCQRCPDAMSVCETLPPPMMTIGGEHLSRCWLPEKRRRGQQA